MGGGHDGLPPAFSLTPTIGPSKLGEHLTGSAPWRLGGAALHCRHAAYKLTWEEIVALYRLTLGQPAVNRRAQTRPAGMIENL
jgi:hypothetical protein